MSRVPGRLGLVMTLGAACGGAITYADDGAALMLRTALLDQVWRELAANDPFFDPSAPQTQQIYAEHAAKLRETADPTERIREIVRAISRFQDGHLALTTRWFLPDKPAPPLPLAGGEPLFRPRIGFERFHRHYYIWFDGAAAPRTADRESDGAPRDRLFCRVVEIDGALVPFGGAWHMLNGPKDTPVTLLLERPDGTRFSAEYVRRQPVVPPRFFAPTTQQVIVDEKTGEQRVEEAEVVIESRRLPDNLGYIRIEHLVTTQVVRDFNAALSSLMDTDGLILDLRDTGGGYPWIMLPIAGRFYDRYAPVARFSCRTPVMRELLRMVGPVGVIPWRPTYRKPLVVLINDRTASMAEGLSFSLGDTGRAVLIGRPTMGLNAAIRNRTLSNGLVLRHSWVRTDRLGRGHYQGVGVEPHERVELGVADVQRLGLQRAIAQERELQLERAVQRLRALTAKAGGGA